MKYILKNTSLLCEIIETKVHNNKKLAYVRWSKSKYGKEWLPSDNLIKCDFDYEIGELVTWTIEKRSIVNFRPIKYIREHSQVIGGVSKFNPAYEILMETRTTTGKRQYWRSEVDMASASMKRLKEIKS